MQAGEIPLDESLLQEQRSKVLVEMAEAERAHDALRQFFAYSSLREDFKGADNGADVESRLEALKRSPELKRALERERWIAEEQEMLMRDTSAIVAQLAAAHAEARSASGGQGFNPVEHGAAAAQWRV